MRKVTISCVFAVLIVACAMLLTSACEQRATSPDQDGRLGAEQDATAQQAEQDATAQQGEPDATVQQAEPDATAQQGGQDSEKFPFLPFPLEFTAEDLYGNTVTAASFGEKQLYYVFFWGTW